MASADQVRQYLGHWFQLGCKVYIRNGDRSLLPSPVIEGIRYSKAFEDCWQTLLAPESGDCYLENTDQTIAELLTPEWEIILCYRCVMPIPQTIGAKDCTSCPCINLSTWPNLDLPQPRSPVDNQAALTALKQRLQQGSAKPLSSDRSSESEESKTSEVVLLGNLPQCQCPNSDRVAQA